MQRYKLTIEYIGTEFNGWQRQEGVLTIQEAIENAISCFNKQENILVYGAGRTDAGVHAINQVAHVDINKIYEPHALASAINFYLRPHAICIKKVELVGADFHARFSAKKRAYKYRIINRFAPLIIDRNMAWHVKQSLNIDKMREAANLILGNHDFTSFRAASCQAKSPIITLDYIEIMQKSSEEIEIHIGARSFLHHMVRNIVGTLYYIGIEKIKPTTITDILQAKDRSKAGITAPSSGLFLVDVLY